MKRTITILALLITLSITTQAKAVDDVPRCQGFWLKCFVQKVLTPCGKAPCKIIVIKPAK